MLFETIVNYSFRVINLLVLIALGVYLFKKYFLSSVEDAIAETEAFESGLRQQEGALENRLDELEVEKNMLEAHCSLLKSKIDRWRERFDEVLQERKQEKFALQKKISAQRNKQENNVIHAKLLKKIVPSAVQQAKAEFISRYSQEKTGSDYVRNLITTLRKSN